MANIVLINPRFEVSYWGLELALPLFLKRANLPTACLPLLAALTPEEHQITLIDENVESIDYDRIAQADIVGLTGMTVQRRRMVEIAEELKRRGVFVVIGGPWVSVREDYFGDLADVIFVGEAEETWPRFLNEWKAGKHQRRYEQAERTDMTKTPVPRYDLLKMQHYVFGSIQFSRGCPFQCEFCDIIITFGRKPRLKESKQVIRELEALRAQGMEIAFIVDDNLIGNKREIKKVLNEVADWQKANGYPFTFFTEASLDLAEDEDLMQAMVDANVNSVFVGIESANEASLKETKKFQNVKVGRTSLERIHAIQNAGLDVWCGMIVGFDNDDSTVFTVQREYLKESRILHAMIGMLYAIPKTPLYHRLATEGRLEEENEEEFGTNVIPTQMTRDELRDGYVKLMVDLYEPNAYFDRLEDLYLRGNFQFGQTRTAYWHRHPWTWFKGATSHLVRAVGIFVQLMRIVPEASLRREYRHRIFRLLRSRPDPVVLFVYMVKCAMHYHHYTLARDMASQEKRIVNSF